MTVEWECNARRWDLGIRFELSHTENGLRILEIGSLCFSCIIPLAMQTCWINGSTERPLNAVINSVLRGVMLIAIARAFHVFE